MSWREFWNGPHSIYVNERHRTVHYRAIARDILRFVPNAGSRVLDYGCGEALGAALVARHCGRLFLYDAAPSVREKLAARLAGDAVIAVLDEMALTALPDNSLDLVVANSLLQYLTRDEFAKLLDFWHGKLAPEGRLIIGDIIPPDASALADASALVAFAARNGFLLRAVSGLVATYFSIYRTLRKSIGLTRYTEDEVTALLKEHGLTGARAYPNIGHNQRRMLFLAKRGESGVEAAARAEVKPTSTV